MLCDGYRCQLEKHYLGVNNPQNTCLLNPYFPSSRESLIPPVIGKDIQSNSANESVPIQAGLPLPKGCSRLLKSEAFPIKM